jgi:NAD(P)-dependent dehydrogenase (short-subunit alcohol dehydrogenase family)
MPYLEPSITYNASTDVAWDFEDQVVMITGAARGQGAEHARALAEAGASLAISDIGSEMESVAYPLGTVQELDGVAEAAREIGSDVLSGICDVRRPDQVQAFVERTIETYGRIDALICNAGVGTAARVTDMTETEWHETVDTDLSGGFYCCRYVAPHMIAAEYGRIVMIGSTQSLVGMSHLASYTASKHGVLGLARGFAPELAPHGVTINVICPSAVDTPMNALTADPRFKEFGESASRLVGAWNIFQLEMMHEHEISEGVLWLASREAAGITGTALMIDGGCTCK